MERLTHEADFGLEDWEETLFFVKSDPNGAYNIIDIAKYQGEPEFDEILKNVALRLAAYENTGLEPENVISAVDMAKVACALEELNAYKKLGSLHRLRELAEADREWRCVVLPCKLGDTVFKIGASICMWRETDHCDEYCNGYEYRDCWEGCRAVCEDKFSLDDLQRFGKNVFLTREAAEAALKAREQE